MLSRQNTSMGAVWLTVLGALLLAHNLLPSELHESPLHAALMFGSVAAAFGAIYAFGYGRRRWARFPAVVFAGIAGLALLAAWPWHWFVGAGLGLPLWPLVLIALGVWLVKRDDRWS
jgi:hypothetical protein